MTPAWPPMHVVGAAVVNLGQHEGFRLLSARDQARVFHFLAAWSAGSIAPVFDVRTLMRVWRLGRSQAFEIRGRLLPWLEWRQVDRVAGVIRLDAHTTKNDDGRVLPYAALPELRTVIAAQWQEHERLRKAGVICPWVFHRNGRPIRSYRGAWRVACVAAGVPGRIPHDFRRTAVRNLVRAGVAEQTSMRITGHKTRSVFDRYDIVNEADLRDAMGRLATGARRTAKR